MFEELGEVELGEAAEGDERLAADDAVDLEDGDGAGDARVGLVYHSSTAEESGDLLRVELDHTLGCEAARELLVGHVRRSRHARR